MGVADVFDALGLVFDLEDAGGDEFLEVFEGEGGDVELEAFAFEFEALEGDVLFAEA